MVSPKTRYLLFFQYFGTKYCGVQEVPSDRAVLGVQNHLEMAAGKIRHATPSKFSISSRTDSGVHALCNAAHLDIERSEGKPPFSGNILTDALNKRLKPEPIRHLRFWEMEFTGPSFLYKQVRRMVGILVAVGQGRLEPREVQRLLEIRDLMAYPANTMAPPDGLFLKNVEYCEADLEISETEVEWQPNGNST